MSYTTTVTDWMKERADSVMEIAGLPVQAQLDKYDASKTGIGFILVLELICVSENDPPKPTHADLVSQPVVKIRGTWVTINEENLSDILSGVVRMIAPDVGEANESGPQPAAGATP